MSLDVYLQRFQAGEPQLFESGPVIVAIREAGAAFDERYGRIATRDGGAEVFGLSEGSTSRLLVNLLEGAEIWNVLVVMARAGDLTLLPVGCPPCVTLIRQVNDLPAELAGSIVVVDSGDELRSVVESS